MVELGKPKNFNKLAAGIIVILVFINFMTFLSYNDRYEVLATESGSLSLDNDNLTNEYNALLSRFISLDMNYSLLQLAMSTFYLVYPRDLTVL